MIQTTGTNVNLFRVNITTGNATIIKSGVGRGSTINAMGFNIVDNLLYASYNNVSNIQLVTLDGAGNVNYLTSLNTTAQYNAGDVDDQARYFASQNGASYQVVDVNPNSATYTQRIASGTASPPFPVIDWAYVPYGGDFLYGLGYNNNFNQTTLMRFSRTTYTWEQLTNFGNVAGRNTWGAVYASSDGDLFGSENFSGQIWRFPLPANGTTPSFVANGPSTNQNDGARCILAL